MRKAVSIVLFLALIMPVMAFFGSLLAVRIQIRQEVKRTLADYDGYEEELILVKIPKDVENRSGKVFIRFEEEEFYYQGTMYDVVRSEEKEEETWYWCYRDREETMMVAKAIKIMEHLFGSEPGQDAQRASLQVFFPQFVAHAFIQCPSPPVADIASATKKENRVQLPNGYFKPPFIPPALG
jgi:hypothetical protein